MDSKWVIKYRKIIGEKCDPNLGKEFLDMMTNTQFLKN